MPRHFDAVVPQAVVRTDLRERLDLVRHDLQLEPGTLGFVDHVVEADVLFLVGVSLNDDANEHVDEEEAEEHDQHHEDNDVELIEASFRLTIDTRGIDRVPHQADPAFTRLEDEQREHASQRIVEVHWRTDPLAAKVKAVPLCRNRVSNLPSGPRRMLQVAAIHLPREQSCEQDRNHEHDKEDNDLQAHDLREGIQERSDGDFKALLALD